jgi:hypothetical protein
MSEYTLLRYLILYSTGFSAITRQRKKLALPSLIWLTITSPGMVNIGCTLVISLLLSGHLIWYFERQANTSFASDYFGGVRLTLQLRNPIHPSNLKDVIPHFLRPVFGVSLPTKSTSSPLTHNFVPLRLMMGCGGAS